MKKLVIIAAVALAGCATQPAWQWVKPGATQADFDQHKAQCDYETSAATQTTDYSLRSSFGQELDRSMRQRDLMTKCMVAKGYRQEPIAAAPQVSVQVRDDCRWVNAGEYRCGR